MECKWAEVRDRVVKAAVRAATTDETPALRHLAVTAKMEAVATLMDTLRVPKVGVRRKLSYSGIASNGVFGDETLVAAWGMPPPPPRQMPARAITNCQLPPAECKPELH